MAVSKVAGPVTVTAETEEEIGEFVVAEYIVFLLAMDTYIRYVEETTGEEDPTDDVISQGIRLLKIAEPKAEEMMAFLQEHLTSETHKKMARRAFFRRISQVSGVGDRALKLRTLLRNTATMRAVFEKNKTIKMVREAVSSSMLDDADAALDRFAVILLKNMRFRAWIRKAADTAGTGEVPRTTAMESGSDSVEEDTTQSLFKAQVEELATPGAEGFQQAQAAQKEQLQKVEEEATQAAQETMKSKGEEDAPPKKSEVIGTITVAVEKALSDPSRIQNVPEPLRRLDDEQRAAALTDGRVLVAAGAGSGKSTSLVARVNYLVRDRRVDPSRILVTSFNKKAAGELKEKIAKSAGEESVQQMSVGTMHSLFRKFIGEYGTGREKIAMGLAKGLNGFVQDGGTVARTVQRIWSECYSDEPAPKLKTVMLYKSLWAGNSITPAQALSQAKGQEEIDAARWYEMYEGLKGAVPGWRPPCNSRSYESFMSRKRPNDIRLADFDDMLNVFLSILKREPGVRKALQKVYDHILVDEAQDLNSVQNSILEMMSEHITDGSDGKSFWMIGDPNQCIHEDTLVSVPGGSVRAGDLVSGCEVLSYRNGKIVPQTLEKVWRSDWEYGYEVTTESGKTLLMSPNHKLWALPLDCTTLGERHIVYLMYRNDRGFRVGVTNRPYKGSVKKASRIQGEAADKLWVLDVVGSKEEALILETYYSLKFSVPQTVFNHHRASRSPSLNRIQEVFREFGENGKKILESKDFSFDLPHWQVNSTSCSDKPRHVVKVLAHRLACNLVTFEWAGEDGLADVLRSQGFTVNCAVQGGSSKPRFIIRRRSASYRKAVQFAEKLASCSGASLDQRLSVRGSHSLRMITASGVLVGMKLPVLNQDSLELEEVVAVKKIKTSGFLDLSVEDASNFFGGGILSHNCIYTFRGARPDLFSDLFEKEGWSTRPIRTNYRCQPEIVETANRLIAHNEDRLPISAVANPQKARGMASIMVETPDDDAAAALGVIENIKSSPDFPDSVSENAVLCRTNKEIHAYETACIIRGVPYARKGASSFLGSPETKTFLSYVQLATGTDFSKMQKAMEEVINRPNRFFLAPDKAADSVKKSFEDYARMMRQDIKTINPVTALQDYQFNNILIRNLIGQSSGFKFEKSREKVQELADALTEMQSNASQEGYKTTDLFDEILSLKGTVGSTDPRTGRSVYVEQSFRDSLKAEIRDSLSDDSDVDDEEEDETEGLGNVSFLFKLAEKDPTDASDLENPPDTPMGFKAKIERYNARRLELRIDVDKWDREQATLPPEQRKAPPATYLGTVHSVKGSEWKNCYVQMPKGKFPFEPRVRPGQEPPDPEKLQAEMESERRLAYVALTRAAKNLTVVCPKVVGGKAAGTSPFVDEAELVTGENVPKLAQVEGTTEKTANWDENLVF